MRRRSILLLLLPVLAAMALWPAGAGLAISLPHPESPRRLTVQGTLTGKFGKGGKLNFSIVATDPLTVGPGFRTGDAAPAAGPAMRTTLGSIRAAATSTRLKGL